MILSFDLLLHHPMQENSISSIEKANRIIRLANSSIEVCRDKMLALI